MIRKYNRFLIAEQEAESAWKRIREDSLRAAEACNWRFADNWVARSNKFTHSLHLMRTRLSYAVLSRFQVLPEAQEKVPASEVARTKAKEIRMLIGLDEFTARSTWSFGSSWTRNLYENESISAVFVYFRDYSLVTRKIIWLIRQDRG